MVIVAPGDCSPSRRVVSKITTLLLWLLLFIWNLYVWYLKLSSMRSLSPLSGRTFLARSEAA